jgi:hypothetical protein
MNEPIAYNSDAILAELLEMSRELRRRAVRLRVTDRLREDEVDLDRLAAAIWFVKRLAAAAGDVALVGEAELLRMEMEDLEDALEQPESRRSSRVSIRPRGDRRRTLDHARTYSSDDIRGLLEKVVTEARRHRHPRTTNNLPADWLQHAAGFVTHLAASATDPELVAAAKFIRLAERRRYRGRELEFGRDGD